MYILISMVNGITIKGAINLPLYMGSAISLRGYLEDRSDKFITLKDATVINTDGTSSKVGDVCLNTKNICFSTKNV